MFDLYRKIESDISLLDRNALVAMVYTAVGLTGTYYLKNPSTLLQISDGTRFESMARAVAVPDGNNLPALAYWVGILMTFYFVIPVLIVKFGFRCRLTDFGLRPQIESGFAKLLLACTALMVPLVYFLSMTAGFAAKYPFFKVADGSPYFGPAFIIWELIYFVQFFGLEFFFRGFLLNSLKPALGAYSIFVMTIPYCMIHFGKPPAETVAAVFAGIFLGWLAYRNGSIWLGLALHCTVAFSMDILALYNKGMLI
jgi:membrane protease YdiL (CAAX protease family)